MGMLSCSAHRHYWESRLPFVSPSWPPPPSPPLRLMLTPTLSSSSDTGSHMPTTPSLHMLPPSARLSLRPSPLARDATPSPTAPPRPLLLAGTSPATRSPPALTSSTSSPLSSPMSTARGRPRPIPAPRRCPLCCPRHHQGDHQALRALAPIVEDVTTDVTKCVPKSVCEDVTAEVLKTVCGEPAAEAEAVEEA